MWLGGGTPRTEGLGWAVRKGGPCSRCAHASVWSNLVTWRRDWETPQVQGLGPRCPQPLTQGTCETSSWGRTSIWFRLWASHCCTVTRTRTLQSNAQLRHKGQPQGRCSSLSQTSCDDLGQAVPTVCQRRGASACDMRLRKHVQSWFEVRAFQKKGRLAPLHPDAPHSRQHLPRM